MAVDPGNARELAENAGVSRRGCAPRRAALPPGTSGWQPGGTLPKSTGQFQRQSPILCVVLPRNTLGRWNCIAPDSHNQGAAALV